MHDNDYPEDDFFTVPESDRVHIWHYHYRQTSNIRRILEGNKLVDHSDVVGASPLGAARTRSSFST